LSGGERGGGVAWGGVEVSGTEFHSFGGSNARHQAMRTKKNPAHPKACGVRWLEPNFVLDSISEAERLTTIGNKPKTANDREVRYQIEQIPKGRLNE
jgi:hypothetical protein